MPVTIRRNKYGVAPQLERTHDGILYASKAEMLYAIRLQHLRNNGDILDFIEQPLVRLGVPENKYRVDFLIIPANPNVEIPYYVDVKGKMTAKFKHDMKLWERYGWLKLVVVKYTGHDHFAVVSELEGRRKTLIS